jgi:hypothetical protein
MQSPFGGLLEDGGLCNLAKNYDRSFNGSSARARRSFCVRGATKNMSFCSQCFVYQRISMKAHGFVEDVVPTKWVFFGSKFFR